MLIKIKETEEIEFFTDLIMDSTKKNKFFLNDESPIFEPDLENEDLQLTNLQEL